MLQRFYGQLPDFARPSNPLLRYTFLRTREVKLGWRVFRIVAITVVVAVLVLFGYELANIGSQAAVDTSSANPLDKVFLVLYWPLTLIQLLVRVFALGSTVGIITTETQRGTWDTLKVTTDGARLWMRTRWASIFYRLWVVLSVILALRIFFIGVSLVNLSYMQGRYLDLLLSGTLPFSPSANISQSASTVIGIVVVAMMMTASLLAPFTAVAFDAALGMFIGTLSRGRFTGLLGQLLLIIGRVLITCWALWVGAAALSMSIFATGAVAPLSDGSLGSWLGGFFGIVEGDLGLTLLHLDNVQHLWADIDYGVLIGVAVLGYVLLQAVLAVLLVRWAGRRAAKAERL